MSGEFKYDVFLSHSAKDKPVVRPLAERLRADGLKVWFDEWVLKPGDSIPAKIEEGLEHSRVLVLCLSAQAFGSDWAQLEAGTFRFRDPLNRERRFIPLRLDDAPIKGSLAQFLYINWRPADREQEYAKLLAACRGESLPLLTNESAGFGPSKTNSDNQPFDLVIEDATASNPPNGGRRKQNTEPQLDGIGEAWSGLRGFLENEYSTKDIKGILGQAGLPVFRIEYTGTYKGPFLDEADILVRSLDDASRDRFVAKCVRQIVAFERAAAERLSKRGMPLTGRTIQSLRQVLDNYGHDLEHFHGA